MGIREFLFFTDGASCHCRISARRITLAACILLGQECCFVSQSEEIKIELENENRLARLAKRERRVLRRIFAFADVVMTSKYDFLLLLHADSGQRMNAPR